ncbi:hypothetical protein IG631_12213 [Alternaria alternata]|nr:hypothetical protein IG631_12213 [Alternaria alternata]
MDRRPVASLCHDARPSHTVGKLERGTVSQVEYYASFYRPSIGLDKGMLFGAHLACVALFTTGLHLSEG